MTRKVYQDQARRGLGNRGRNFRTTWYMKLTKTFLYSMHSEKTYAHVGWDQWVRNPRKKQLLGRKK